MVPVDKNLPKLSLPQTTMLARALLGYEPARFARTEVGNVTWLTPPPRANYQDRPPQQDTDTDKPQDPRKDTARVTREKELPKRWEKDRSTAKSRKDRRERKK